MPTVTLFIGMVMARYFCRNAMRRATPPRSSAATRSVVCGRALARPCGRVYLVALPLLAAVCSAGSAVASPSAAELYERGRAALLRGDYQQAIELLEDAVARDPDHLGHRLLLARACEYDGRPAWAEAEFGEIVKRQPQHREAALALARGCFERQAYARVVELLQPLRAEADAYEVHHLLGTALYHEGKLAEARRELTQAVACDGSNAADHRLLGDIALTQEKFALAVEAYEKANRLGLDDAQLHLMLATAHFRLRNYLGDVQRRTIEHGRSGTIREPGYVLESDPFAGDSFYVSPPRSAIFHAKKALELGLDSPELHLLLGDIWLEARRHERALAEYRDIEPRVPRARLGAYCYNCARALLGAGDSEGYLARLRMAAELDGPAYAPLLEPAYLRVAELCNQDGDVRKYIEYVRLAVKHAPDSSDLRYRLGNALWESGSQQEAVRQWRITLELRRDHPDRARMLELIQATRLPNGN